MKDFKFTIITPTIGRKQLVQTVKSVREQKYRKYEHLIIYDGIQDSTYNDIFRMFSEARTKVIATNQKFNDYGHSVRKYAYDFAKGDYITYQDDDDYYLPDCFTTVNEYLKLNDTDFVVYPVIRLGQVFFNIPAGLGRTTSTQYFHKKIANNGDQIRFTSGGYNHDGNFIEECIRKYSFKYLITKPLGVVTQVGRGEL